jgi:hypothetical protein
MIATKATSRPFSPSEYDRCRSRLHSLGLSIALQLEEPVALEVLQIAADSSGIPAELGGESLHALELPHFEASLISLILSRLRILGMRSGSSGIETKRSG